MGRATTLLVRRAEGARQLVLQLRRLPHAAGLYPLRLTVSIPSPEDSQRRVFEVPAGGAESLSVDLDLPRDLPPGVALDVVLESDRVVSAAHLLAARSLYIESIEQR